MAGDIKFELGVAIEGAMRNLDNFSKKIEKIGGDFENLNSKLLNFAAVGAAALTGLAASAAAFADEMADVAAANETSITSVLALSAAMQAVGGSGDNVGRMFQTMNNNIESAASGNLKMAATFQKMGIGMNELATMSQEDIRNKLIKSISEITDPAERSAKAMEVFGKAAMGMDFTKLASEIDTNTQKYAQYEASISTAAEAFDKMGSIIKDLKIAATVAFEPLFKYIKNLKIDVDVLVVAIRLFAAAVAAAVGASVLAGFVKLIGLVRTLTAVSRANPLIAIASAALGIATALGVWENATGDVESANADLNKEVDKTAEKTTTIKRDVSGLADQYKKQKETLTQVNEQFMRQVQNVKDKLTYEQQSLTLSEDQKKVKEQQNSIEQNMQNALMQLKQKYDAMDATARAARAGDYEKEKKLIETNASAAMKDVESRIQATQRLKTELKLMQNISSAFAAEEQKIFEAVTKQKIDNAPYKERINLETKLEQITAMRSALMGNIGKLSDTERQKGIDAITKVTNNVDLLKESHVGVTTEIQKGLNDLVTAGDLTQKIKDKLTEDIAFTTLTNYAEELKKIADQSRTFSAGWNKAFSEYADNAFNAANSARNIFAKMTSGMEDLFVNFTKTGKFEWKNFISMMIEELLRSQLRQLIANVFSTPAMGGSTSWIGKMMGFANGGIIPTNAPVLVGERGPEIISGAGGRVVTPNHQLGGATSVTYNINAVDAPSFKQMIAQDPSFLYAVTQQGAKGMPTRR